MTKMYSTKDPNNSDSNPTSATTNVEVASHSDDTYRYIEHLQKQLIGHGWEDFFRDESWPNKDQFETILQLVALTLAETDGQVLDMAYDSTGAARTSLK